MTTARAKAKPQTDAVLLFRPDDLPVAARLMRFVPAPPLDRARLWFYLHAYGVRAPLKLPPEKISPEHDAMAHALCKPLIEVLASSMELAARRFSAASAWGTQYPITAAALARACTEAGLERLEASKTLPEIDAARLAARRAPRATWLKGPVQSRDERLRALAGGKLNKREHAALDYVLTGNGDPASCSLAVYTNLSDGIEGSPAEWDEVDGRVVDVLCASDAARHVVSAVCDEVCAPWDDPVDALVAALSARGLSHDRILVALARASSNSDALAPLLYLAEHETATWSALWQQNNAEAARTRNDYHRRREQLHESIPGVPRPPPLRRPAGRK